MSFRVRTISYFIGALHTSEEGWREEIERGAAFLRQAQAAFEEQGYEVQTARIVTRALAGAATAAAAAATAAQLEWLCLAAGVTFLSLGATSSEELLRQGCFQQIAAVTRYTSCSFSWQRGNGQRTAAALADTIHSLAEASAGAANFRFGVAFNCPPGIPYFPAAAAAEGVSGFALGTENSGLLHAAFQQAAAEAAAAADEPGGSGGSGADHSVLDAAQASLARLLTARLQPLEGLARQLAAASGVPYLGIDASIAPALEPPSLADAYEALGLGRFGGAGTLAVSERITAALKSLPLQLCGYTGLMLPVCEDSGLAAAANDGRIGIGSLLHFSAVCGCGLDTVPVPGATQQQPAGERAALLRATAALLHDVAALAFRLDKPLSARLLPVPGGRAGEETAFDSPYLLNCKVLPLLD